LVLELGVLTVDLLSALTVVPVGTRGLLTLRLAGFIRGVCWFSALSSHHTLLVSPTPESIATVLISG
jgi:hypothetical protein